MSWRDEKKAHKARIHAQFAIPAVYLPFAAGIPLGINARLHNAPADMGIPSMETRQKPPAYEEDAPKLVFDESEIPAVVNKAYVIFSADEIYRAGVSTPPIMGYYTVTCARLSANQCATLVSSINASADPLPAVYDGILV